MDTSEYSVGKLLGETEDFRIYECTLSDGGVGILKIAVTCEKNPLLDREAFILRTMRDEALWLESEYEKVKKDPNHALNYQISFPNLIESFLAQDQGMRRINIVNFTAITDDLGCLVPIAHIASRDCVRVDPKTSAWMLGKLLKILVFAHSQGISIGKVTGDNVLIERKEHYVIIFDWSEARIHSGGVPAKVTCAEIAQAAGEVILALGGNPSTGEIPADPQLVDDQYRRLLYRLALSNVSDAASAHEAFYALVRSLWPHEYWPFTSYPL